MKLYGILVNSLAGYEIRYEERNGRQHIVAPVVMLVEGVHSGTAGPVLYPLEELRDFPGSWDGRPVTLGHPTMEDGSAISAASPEMMDRFAIGTLFNTRFDSERRGLVSEIWIDVERTRRMSVDVLDALMAGQPLEVSTGLWFEDSGGPGVWGDGENFNTTARDFRPDHLALLPDSTGACSVADGCGVRVNEEEKLRTEEDDDMSRGFKSFLRRFVAETESKEDQISINMEQFAANKPGMLTTVRALQRQLDSMDRDVPNGVLVHYLEDAYEDGTFVMRANGPDGVSYFKGNYTVAPDTGDVEIGNDFTQVREQRDFVEMQAQEESKKPETEREVGTMTTKETLINSLIGCGKTHFTEDHREILMGLEESDLEKFVVVDPPAVPDDNKACKDKDNAPEANVVENKGTEEKVKENAAPVEEAQPEEKPNAKETEGPSGLEAFIATAPEEFRGVLSEAVKANDEKKKALIKAVLGVPGNKFTEENLQGKDVDELEALEALIGDKEDVIDNEPRNIGEPMGRVVNFSGRPAIDLAGNEDNQESPPMGRPGLADLTK